MKRLSAQQRERATELLYQADELEQQIADIEEEIKKVDGSADLDEDSTIDVEGKVCEGTTIFIREYKVILDKELRGPVRISLEDSKGRFHVVAHNKVTNTQKILTSKKLSLAELRKQ